MAIIVKRFRVRYNGVVYGPGQPGGNIITGLSKEEETRLIAGSNGTIEKYVPIETTQIKTPEPAENKEAKEKSTTATELTAKKEGTAPEDMKIPEIDPEELIKPKKGRE